MGMAKMIATQASQMAISRAGQMVETHEKVTDHATKNEGEHVEPSKSTATGNEATGNVANGKVNQMHILFEPATLATAAATVSALTRSICNANSQSSKEPGDARATAITAAGLAFLSAHLSTADIQREAVTNQ